MNIKANIKVNLLDKSAFFKGKNGDTYCSIILWENREGKDRFGNTHSIKQDLGKERKGERSEYVGNAQPIRSRQSLDDALGIKSPTPSPARQESSVIVSMEDDSSIPF